MPCGGATPGRTDARTCRAAVAVRRCGLARRHRVRRWRVPMRCRLRTRDGAVIPATVARPTPRVTICIRSLRQSSHVPTGEQGVVNHDLARLMSHLCGSEE